MAAKRRVSRDGAKLARKKIRLRRDGVSEKMLLAGLDL